MDTGDFLLPPALRVSKKGKGRTNGVRVVCAGTDRIGGKMRAFWGITLILLGIGLGVYFGIFVLFIGGIFQFISGLSPFDVSDVGWGIIKVVLSGLVGWGTFGVLTAAGVVVLSEVKI